MKTAIALAGALALAACSSQADTTTDASPGATETAAPTAPSTEQTPAGDMVGTYELTRPDGTVARETLRPDGTFTYVAGIEITTGTWRMDGAKNCFDPEGDAAEVCYTSTPPAADGSFTATHPDGSTISVRKVAAAPPT